MDKILVKFVCPIEKLPTVLGYLDQNGIKNASVSTISVDKIQAKLPAPPPIAPIAPIAVNGRGRKAKRVNCPGGVNARQRIFGYMGSDQNKIWRTSELKELLLLKGYRAQTVYATLQDLKENGIVDRVDDGEYILTAKGRSMESIS